MFKIIRKGDTIPGLFTGAIGAVTLYFVLSNKKMVIISTKKGASLGSGFFPFVCGIALLLLGLVLFVRGLRQNGRLDYFHLIEEKKENLKSIGLLLFLCITMLAGWKISKQFFYCLPVYSVLVNRIMKRSWLFSILFSVVVTLFVYLLFHMGFHVTFRP